MVANRWIAYNGGESVTSNLRNVGTADVTDFKIAHKSYGAMYPFAT